MQRSSDALEDSLLDALYCDTLGLDTSLLVDGDALKDEEFREARLERADLKDGIDAQRRGADHRQQLHAAL